MILIIGNHQTKYYQWQGLAHRALYGGKVRVVVTIFTVYEMLFVFNNYSRLDVMLSNIQNTGTF